jgi:hypothetical protein
MPELTMIQVLVAWASGRIAELRQNPDRGEGPVPWAIIVGTSVVAALGVGALVVAAVSKYSAKIK